MEQRHQQMREESVMTCVSRKDACHCHRDAIWGESEVTPRGRITRTSIVKQRRYRNQCCRLRPHTWRRKPRRFDEFTTSSSPFEHERIVAKIYKLQESTVPTEHCPECPDQRAMLHFTYRDLHCVVVASILVAANHQDLVPDVRRLGRLLAPDPAHCQGHVESVTHALRCGLSSQAQENGWGSFARALYALA